MADKQPMQSDGGAGKRAPDGVEDPASNGESKGGAYPNPHTDGDGGHFDGGQSHKGYEGPENPNATTGSDQ
jgi:hypothetical protein